VGTVIDDMRIEWVSLDEIARWPRNPKDHDLGLLHQSFGRWGFVKPLLIDEGTGKLIAGHGRLDALLMNMRSGASVPPGIKVEGGMWMVPVIRGIEFENEMEAEAFVVADNRTTEAGGWLEDRLADVLQDHVGNLQGIGFDRDDIDAMVDDLKGDGGDEERPEIDFTAELLEEHNYVVFVFNKSFDWYSVQASLGIKSVKALDSKGGYERKGIGRVLDGTVLIDLIEGR